MRAALHLPSNAPSSPTLSPRPVRHRFVQDGEVPVVSVSQRHPQHAEHQAAMTELERALAAEQELRQAAEKALQRAEDTIRQLQTRLAHAEITRREAEAAALRLAAEPAPAKDVARDVGVPAEAKSPEPERRPRGRPRKIVAPAPEPTSEPAEDGYVDWWNPGWRERFRTRSAKP